MHILNFLLSAVAFLLLAFALHLLLTKQGNRLLNGLLALPLLGRFGQVCVFLLLGSDYQYAFPFFQQVSTPLFFAAPACSYLYIRYFIEGRERLRKRDLLHLIPVVFAVIHVLPMPWLRPLNWDVVAGQILSGGQLSVTERMGLFSGWYSSVGQSLLLGGYLIATWHYVLSSGFIKRKRDINTKWLWFFLSVSSFFKLQSFAVLMLNISGQPYIQRPAFIAASCVVLLFMMAFVLYQPRILYGYIVLSPEDTGRGELRVASAIRKKASPTIRKKLDPALEQKYLEALQGFLDKERFFLQPDFQMKDLAKAVDIPVHHCSLLINNAMGKNFRDWLNSLRIQYFIKEYPALAGTMTIEAIALQSGFRNIATFYNAFKKETGKMPTAYFAVPVG